MSQRALKKRELLNCQKQERDHQHQLYRKQQQQQQQKSSTKYAPKSTYPSPDNGNISIKSNLNKHKFSSTPNLITDNIKNVFVPKRSHILRGHSETDLSCIPEDSILVNAKSEFHLKSIASTRVRQTDAVDTNGNLSDHVSKSNKFNQNKTAHAVKRMSTQSGESSRMTTCSIASSPISDSIRTQSPRTGFADADNIRVPIIGYEVMEERARFTVYKLRIENPFTNDCWLVLRRYTDFQRLNNKLKTAFPQLTFTLPRKKLFGDNFSSIFLSNRVQGLQMFINAVMANEQLRSSQIVRDFFCLDEPPAYSESMEECRAIFEAQEETISHLKMQLRAKDDVIVAMQRQLNDEIERNRNLSSAINLTYDNCSDCSKKIADYLNNKNNASDTAK